MSGTDIEIIVEFEDAQIAQNLFHYAKKYLKKEVPFSSIDQAIRLLAGDKEATTTYLPNPLENESRAAMVPKYGDIDFPMEKEDFSNENPNDMRLNLEAVTLVESGLVSIKFFTEKHFFSHDLVDTVLSLFELNEVRSSEVAVMNDFDGNIKRYRADRNGHWECKSYACEEESLAWRKCF